MARDLVSRAQYAEAVTLLVQSANRNHRAVKRLLAEIQPNLIKAAQHSADLSLWDRCIELLSTAASCAALPVDAEALRLRVAALQKAERDRDERMNRRLQLVDQRAEQGRIVSALGILARTDNSSNEAVRHVRGDLQALFADGIRHLDEAEAFLDNGHLAAARERLDRAAETHYAQPRLVELNARYQQDCAAKAPAPVMNPSLPHKTPVASTTHAPGLVVAQSTTLPARFLINEEMLVITGSEVIVGNSRGVGVTLPLLANVHSRHTMLVRHRNDWQLVTLPNCPVEVNGVTIVGVHLLADGDIIKFGTTDCRWRFTRPIATSATVVLDCCGSFGTALIAPATTLRRCILLAADLRLTPTTGGHVQIPDLPGESLIVRRMETGLMLTAVDAGVYVRTQTDSQLLTDSPIRFPAELLIRTALDEAELLRRGITGQPAGDELSLSLRAI